MTRDERIAELRATLVFYVSQRYRHEFMCGCGHGGECPARRALSELEAEARARWSALVAAVGVAA